MKPKPAIRNLCPRLAVLALSGVLAACGGSSEAPGTSERRAVKIVSTTVQTETWSDAIEALGTTRAAESLVLTAKVTETVERVNFEDGDVVVAGDVLVDLSGRAEVAQLEEAQAAYKEAEQQYRRQAELVEQGTISRSQLDSQVAARDAARARVSAIRARLADRVITAPFDGVLGFRQVSPGTLVTPGTPIATLDSIAQVKLDFAVPERFLSVVASGQEIVARSVAWPDHDFRGRVTSVDSRVDPVTRAVTVRAELPNPDRRLRPGMLLTVRLFEPERQTIVIPEIALIQVGAASYVYRVDADDTVSQVKVTTGARRRGEVEVVEGLSPGDRIVVEGTVKVRPGTTVVEAAADDSRAAEAAAATTAAR